MNKTWNESSNEVGKSFSFAFGRTPLKQRLDDILNKSISLSRYSDLQELEEVTGYLMASMLMLCNECNMSPDKLVENALEKIAVRQDQYITLGRKTQVAILGGAFDPPTIGHIKLAQFVLDSSKTFDEVWLMPCNQHMANKKMTDANARCDLLNKSVLTDPRIKLFEYEIEHGLRGETYNLVKKLLSDEKYSDEYDFSLIMGMDNANTFFNWVNYEELERIIRFVVVNREGIGRDSSVDWYMKPPHIYLEHDNIIPDISSTKIREVIKKSYLRGLSHEEQTFLVDNMNQEALAYIMRKRLYAPDDEYVSVSIGEL